MQENEILWAIWCGAKHPQHWKAIDELWNATPEKAGKILSLASVYSYEACPEMKKSAILFIIALKSYIKHYSI
jgi:hypothetical protein